MSKRRKYLKRPSEFVTAVQINFDLDGFTYHKWGAMQRSHRGDWLINDNGDVHTVESESFARTYRQTSPGTYIKSTPVWAEIATVAGEVSTKEGTTHFEPGDYVVYNEPDGGDGYAVAKGDFERMYEALD